RHVAPQLVPDVALDAGRDFDVESGGSQLRGNRVRAGHRVAGGLTDDQALTAVVPYQTRLRRRARRMDDATDNPTRRQRRLDLALRIDRDEPQVAISGAEAMKEPPRHAVHRREHRRFRTEQRSDGRGDTAKRRTLDRYDDQVLRAEGRRSHGDVR